MKNLINIHFIVNNDHYYARGTAPCTEKAYQNGEFSEKYIIKCIYCLIIGHMEVELIEGNPKLVDWSFEYVNS